MHLEDGVHQNLKKKLDVPHREMFRLSCKLRKSNDTLFFPVINSSVVFIFLIIRKFKVTKKKHVQQNKDNFINFSMLSELI